MANKCDVDGTELDPKAVPPNLEQVVIRFAAEEYDLTLCADCKATKTLSEIIAKAHGKPGGTAEGADSLKYLVRR